MKLQNKERKMQTSNQLYLIHNLLIFNFFTTLMAEHSPQIFCGKTQIPDRYWSPNSSVAFPLNQMILCKSGKLYFRTSLGLFPVSSINYTSKILTISHPSCSSSRHYVSPSLLSAGFPSPPQPNSLILFNCLNKGPVMTPYVRNCSHQLHACAGSSKIQEHETKLHHSCLLVDNLEKLDMGFHPNDLSCSHYKLVYRSSDDNKYAGYEMGTRISFGIPDHVPDICSECEKPNGNCGVGLRCICHAKDCKDKVISMGESLNPFGNALFSLLSSILVLACFMNY